MGKDGSLRAMATAFLQIRNLQPAEAAHLQWAETDRTLQRVAHVALVGEPACTGDFGQWSRTAAQHGDGRFDATPPQVVTGRTAMCASERASEIHRMQAGLAGQFCDPRHVADIVAQPRTDISIAKLIARVLVSTGNKANIQKCVPRTDCDPSGHDAQCLQLKCRL